MKKRPVFIFILLIIAALGTLQFIKKNNDHLACSETTTLEKTEKGETVLVKQHNCKERFPL